MQEEQSYSVANHETNATPPLWNPDALANWSLLLTPIFGSYLVSENYKAMGNSKDAKSAMDWFYIGIAAILSAFLIVPLGMYGFGIWMLIYLAYLLSWFFMSARKQKHAVLSKYGKNYERQPWGKVLVISIVAIVVLPKIMNVFI
ncbi:MAG: hypothetical protein PHP85_13055 [Gallionella sp.]|nr:hypothetical protein [Gallionella sp.]